MRRLVECIEPLISPVSLNQPLWALSLLSTQQSYNLQQFMKGIILLSLFRQMPSYSRVSRPRPTICARNGLVISLVLSRMVVEKRLFNVHGVALTITRLHIFFFLSHLSTHSNLFLCLHHYLFRSRMVLTCTCRSWICFTFGVESYECWLVDDSLLIMSRSMMKSQGALSWSHSIGGSYQPGIPR